jgi:hypothetical protein
MTHRFFKLQRAQFEGDRVACRKGDGIVDRLSGGEVWLLRQEADGDAARK